MSQAVPATIVNVGYRSTNYWVVSAATSRLLVDIGWPGTLGTMKANLKRMGVPLREIRYALATHYHIDHAGLAEELKMEGIPLLDDGSVFTGDPPPEPPASHTPVALTTWGLLRGRGATRVYPAHGPVRSMDETPDYLP